MKTNRNKHGGVRPPSKEELGLDDRNAGKGDSPRNCFSDAFKQNFPTGGMGTADGFIKRRGKLVKVYR